MKRDKKCFFFFYNETNDSLRGDPPHPSIRRDVVYIAALERGYGSKKKRNIKELIEPINLKHLFKDKGKSPATKSDDFFCRYYKRPLTPPPKKKLTARAIARGD